MWWGTAVECTSAFAQLRREGELSSEDEGMLARRLAELGQVWHQMLPGDQLRTQALRVLRLHPLRAADALQLAAALEWAGSPSNGVIVTFDERLSSAATREGFEVLGD